MASVWLHMPREAHPEKVVGYLEGRKAVKELHKQGVTFARKMRAKLTWLHELEGKLELPSGDTASIYLEAYSPSSKPETGQGRLWDETGGVLKLKNGVLIPLTPPKPKEPSE